MDVQPPQSSLPAIPEDSQRRSAPEEKLVRYSPQNRPPVARAPGMTLDDIYYVLFRQKWKILFCSTVGFLVAVAVFFFKPAPFESDAKLYIRYVLEGKSAGPAGSGSDIRTPDQGGEHIINSECEILSSYDLAQQVADAIGPEKLLTKPGHGNDRVAAATAIVNGLAIEVPTHSSVIRIAFRHTNPEIVQPVLRQVIDSYLKKHIQIHQTTGVSDDFLIGQVDQLRTQLAQTEQDLRAARKAAGVLSLEESKRIAAEQISRIRQELFSAEAELAERKAVAKGFSSHPATPPSVASNDTAPGAELSEGVVVEYRGVSARLEGLWRKRQELLTQFTEENELVKGVREQIANAENLKRGLEEAYPKLLLLNTTPVPRPAEQFARPAADPAEGAMRIMALESRIKVLNSQMEQLRTEAAAVDDGESAIADLQRKKEVQEANYRHFAASLDQARFDEAVGAGKVSNISVVQRPSPPERVHGKRLKLMAGAVLGGLFAGLVLAFLVELKFDHTVKRPGEVEAKLRLPLFISIPFMTAKKAPRQDKEAAAGSGALAKRNLEGELPLHQFHEALRDRLMADFEAKNLTHKPKLIAVTSPGHGSGVSTTAAGLAASLSETGDGNVLLVDMNPQQGAAQHFYQGKPICRLDEALYDDKNARVQDNLYVVTEGSNGEQLAGGMPKRFSQLVPKLKVSNYDYIIFDMPPVSQTSVTARLAKFMDTMLLVLESEQTDQRAAQQAAALLADSKTSVCTVLNKTRTYVPRQLSHDFLSET